MFAILTSVLSLGSANAGNEKEVLVLSQSASAKGVRTDTSTPPCQASPPTHCRSYKGEALLYFFLAVCN